MKIRRTSDPDVCYMTTDPVTLWTCGIVEFRVDTRKGKFVMTPITRDGNEGPVIDATGMHEKFLRERG
jgi:hypothetical protein